MTLGLNKTLNHSALAENKKKTTRACGFNPTASNYTLWFKKKKSARANEKKKKVHVQI